MVVQTIAKGHWRGSLRPYTAPRAAPAPGAEGSVKRRKGLGMDTLQRGVQWIGGAVDWGSIIQ